MGVTAIEMAKGEPPYADLHPMRVLFLIPKNPPPTLEGKFSQPFREFVATCLQKDPNERPTVKDLLKHKFITKAKGTKTLTELIERRAKFIKEGGKVDVASTAESSSDHDEPKDGEKEDDDGGWDWDDTVKAKTPAQKAAVAGLVESPGAGAGAAAPASVKDAKDKDKKKKDSSTKSATKAANGDKKDKDKKKVKEGSSGKLAPAAAAPSSDKPRPTSLTSIIYPAIAKLLANNKDPNLSKALGDLKNAFDAAEDVQSGITHNFVAQVIETLKRYAFTMLFSNPPLTGRHSRKQHVVDFVVTRLFAFSPHVLTSLHRLSSRCLLTILRQNFPLLLLILSRTS